MNTRRRDPMTSLSSGRGGVLFTNRFSISTTYWKRFETLIHTRQSGLSYRELECWLAERLMLVQRLDEPEHRLFCDIPDSGTGLPVE